MAPTPPAPRWIYLSVSASVCVGNYWNYSGIIKGAVCSVMTSSFEKLVSCNFYFYTGNSIRRMASVNRADRPVPLLRRTKHSSALCTIPTKHIKTRQDQIKNIYWGKKKIFIYHSGLMLRETRKQHFVNILMRLFFKRWMSHILFLTRLFLELQGELASEVTK